MKHLLVLCSLFALAAAVSAETVVKTFPLKSGREVTGWGGPVYQDCKVTAADGTARLEIVKAKDTAGHSYQWSVPCNMEFYAGTVYTITGTVKANRDVPDGNFIFQQNGGKYTIFTSKRLTLKAGTPQDFRLVYTPKTDILEPTRIVSLHVPLPQGTVLELKHLKVEFQAPAWLYPQPRKEAKTFYLAPDGNDRADGSAKSPWKTIAKANKFLFPGDTVQFRPGVYAGTIAPVRSGTAGKSITYKGGKDVRLTGGKDGWCIAFRDREYITIEGFSARETGSVRWIYVNNIANCIFRDLAFSGSRGSCPIQCFGIRNCLFDRILAERTLSVNGSGLVSGDMWNNHKAFGNVFQNMYISRAGHRPFGIMEGSDANVIRNTVFDGRYGRNFEMFFPSRTLMERCTVTNAYDGSGSADPRAKWFVSNSIFRYNVLTRNNGMPLVANSYYDRWHKLQLGITDSRMYGNTFYMNDCGGWDMSEDNGRKDKDKAYIAGNIYCNNVFFDNDRAGAGTAVMLGGKFKTGSNLFRRNILCGDRPGKHVVRRGWSGFLTLAEAEKTLPDMFRDNLDLDPQFTDGPGGDLRLKNGSPAIDRGMDLAEITADSSGNIIKVSDAAMFYDGYGIPWEKGDLVYIGPDKLQARVAKADRKKQELTLDRKVAVKAGWSVNLPYAGKAPDLGAYEHGMATGPAKLPGRFRQPGHDRIHAKPLFDHDFEPADMENWFAWYKKNGWHCWGWIDESCGARGSSASLTVVGTPMTGMEIDIKGNRRELVQESRKTDLAVDSALRIRLFPPQWDITLYPYVEFDYKLVPGTPWGAAINIFRQPQFKSSCVYLGGTDNLQVPNGVKNLKKFRMIADGKWHTLKVDVRAIAEVFPGVTRVQGIVFRCGHPTKWDAGTGHTIHQAWLDNVKVLDK